jgi:glycosyltransferase involved in cell wall biosynthesis
MSSRERAAPLMSFIIPAWNEEALLPRCLQSLHQAAQDVCISYEIVVADDDSSDDTADVARAFGAQVMPCRYRQIASARNAGARLAKGDILVFVDADTQVTAEVVRGTLKAVVGGATYGGADVDWDGRIPLWSRLYLRTAETMNRWRRLASGAYLFCTRDAFDRAGGFDESLYAAEEYDFSQRLGKGKKEKHAWVAHKVVTSGRKLRSHSPRELIGTLVGMRIRGRKGLHTRERLGLWYEERPADPGAKPAANGSSPGHAPSTGHGPPPGLDPMAGDAQSAEGQLGG